MTRLMRRALTITTLIGAARIVARRRRAIDFAGRTVVITGGSRGLGLEMARLFAAENARLVLLARNQTELDQWIAIVFHRVAPCGAADRRSVPLWRRLFADYAAGARAPSSKRDDAQSHRGHHELDRPVTAGLARRKHGS